MSSRTRPKPWVPLLLLGLLSCGREEARPTESPILPPEDPALIHLSFDGAEPHRLPEGLAVVRSGEGTETVPGVHGDALRFDGSGSHLRIENAGTLPIEQAMTLELFVRYDGENPVRPSGLYTLAAHSTIFSLAVSPDLMAVRARVETASGRAKLASGRRALREGRWHHVALTYDGAEVVLHVDGVPAARAEATGKVALEPDVDLVIGTWYQTNQALFGAIDELRLHDRALTSRELAARAPDGRSS